jgi:hypothetical protein
MNENIMSKEEYIKASLRRDFLRGIFLRPWIYLNWLFQPRFIYIQFLVFVYASKEYAQGKEKLNAFLLPYKDEAWVTIVVLLIGVLFACVTVFYAIMIFHDLARVAGIVSDDDSMTYSNLEDSEKKMIFFPGGYDFCTRKNQTETVQFYMHFLADRAQWKKFAKEVYNDNSRDREGKLDFIAGVLYMDYPLQLALFYFIQSRAWKKQQILARKEKEYQEYLKSIKSEDEKLVEKEKEKQRALLTAENVKKEADRIRKREEEEKRLKLEKEQKEREALAAALDCESLDL